MFIQLNAQSVALKRTQQHPLIHAGHLDMAGIILLPLGAQLFWQDEPVKVYFTTDGTDPTKNSQQWDGVPLILDPPFPSRS